MLRINLHPAPQRLITEAARVAALETYAVLDTPPTAQFDAFALQAAAVTRSPVARISFLDQERQWVKASTGSDLRTTPRHLSFCHHTIDRESGVLIIPDAAMDPRFSRHPLVYNDPYLRFYAGVTLVDRDGYRLGTVSVLGHSPRRLDLAGLAALQSLSADVVDCLTLHRAGLDYRGAALLELEPPVDDHVEPEDGPPAVQGWLGVRTERTTRFKGSEQRGLLLLSIAQGSPAERASLMVGDILLAIAGRPTHRSGDIATALAKQPLGEPLQLRIWRDGRAMQCEMRVEPMPWSRRSRQRAL